MANSMIRAQGRIDKELDYIRKHLDYHNNWDGNNVWWSDLQVYFDSVLKQNNIDQIITPLRIDVVKAFNVLSNCNNAKIAKLFSIFIDLYDELPYRPDAAFDFCWRSFEILTVYYLKEVLSLNTNVTEGLQKISCVFNRIIGGNSNLLTSFDYLFTNQSLASLRFCVNYLADSSSVPSSYDLLFNKYKNNIENRFKLALAQTPKDNNISTTLFDEFKKKYFSSSFYANVVSNNSVDAFANVSKAAKCLRLILIGDKDPIELNTIDFPPISFEKRIELLLSGILYSIRNNRFHGDNYSLLKSSASTNSVYHSMYHCLISTYAFFWILLYDYFRAKNVTDMFFSLDDISDFINESVRRLQYLPNN